MCIPYILNGETTIEGVRTDFLNLFFAGNDTSSHSLSSFMFFMFKNPSVWKKAKAEVEKQFLFYFDLDRYGGYDELMKGLNELPYLENVIKEIHRIDGSS